MEVYWGSFGVTLWLSESPGPRLWASLLFKVHGGFPKFPGCLFRCPYWGPPIWGNFNILIALSFKVGL